MSNTVTQHSALIPAPGVQVSGIVDRNGECSATTDALDPYHRTGAGFDALLGPPLLPGGDIGRLLDRHLSGKKVVVCADIVVSLACSITVLVVFRVTKAVQVMQVDRKTVRYTVSLFHEITSAVSSPKYFAVCGHNGCKVLTSGDTHNTERELVVEGDVAGREETSLRGALQTCTLQQVIQ